MPSPEISVIVPVYNAEKYLRRCVDSILAQTYTGFELLLVDDGSTDASAAICDEYAVMDSRVRVFHKPNGGASSARNVGLDNARGEWIAFADADDYVYIHWLENFNVSNLDGINLSIQGVRADKPLNKELSQDYTYSIGLEEGSVTEAINKLLEVDLLGYLWIKIFRKKVIRTFNIRFNEGLDFLEDEMWVIEYLSHVEKVVACHDIGYFYHVPDWRGKYYNGVIVYRQLLEKANEFKFEQLKYRYTKYITEGLFDSFVNEDWNNRRSAIKKVKLYLSDYEKYCTIHPISKLIIFHVSWVSLITVFYSLHVWLKNK